MPNMLKQMGVIYKLGMLAVWYFTVCSIRMFYGYPAIHSVNYPCLFVMILIYTWSALLT